MKQFFLVFLFLLGLGAAPDAKAFVLVGPMDITELTSDGNGTGGIDFNYTDDLGGPKDLKTFFRWNIPLLTYAFDASFMQYFGLEGRAAVKESFDVINDFFSPQEDSAQDSSLHYDGVSALDLGLHGFRNNYTTVWGNTTAKNAHVIDIKSLTLGLLVNQLGLGNPYRYAFGIHSTSTNAAATQINFNVRQRNFDPITYKPSSHINNVEYSYRLIHDAPPSVGVTQIPSFADMEEFTTDTTDNAWSAVAAIADAFYGNTAIFWTEQPTLFGFGMFYDKQNASDPLAKYDRHALTYDDAGGLKYLYRTNNYVYEGLDPNVVLVIPANFLPTYAIPVYPGGSARTYPDPTGISGAYIPRRNAGLIPGLPITSSVPVQAPPSLVDIAMRGGIDKIQFQEQPFDSFLGITFTATTHSWTDVFVGTNGQNVINLNNTTPGASAYIGVPQLKHFSQNVGRAIFQPDILFVADELGVSADGIPIAFNRTDSQFWTDNYTNNLGPAQLLTTQVGPGTIAGPIQYTFTKLGQGFEVVWSGEASVVGNTDMYSLWGHIRGSGPNDFVVFPNDARVSILENAISPATTPPMITGIQSIDVINRNQNVTLRRTEHELKIEGSNLASVTAVQIIDNNNNVVQELTGANIQAFIVSHNQMIIPPGHLNEKTEGNAGTRLIRLWNAFGPSAAYEDNSRTPHLAITSGSPVVTHTDHDLRAYNRGDDGVSLKFFGYGFKSGDGSELSFFRVSDKNGTYIDGNYDISGSGALEPPAKFEVISDNEAKLEAGEMSAKADGPDKYVQVSRDHIEWSMNGPDAATGLGPNSTVRGITNGTNLIAHITATPLISGLKHGNQTVTEYLERDRAITVTGTALNTAERIEIVDAAGNSLSPVAAIEKNAAAQWQPAGVTTTLPLGISESVDGKAIYISQNVFGPSADSGSPENLRKLMVVNAAGKGYSNTFNVIAEPQALFVGGFTTPFAFNRGEQAGDTIIISGLNLSSVSEIEIVEANGTSIDDNSTRTRLQVGGDGFTISDNAIVLDARKAKFQFDEVDSNDGNSWRRFRLYTANNSSVLTPHDHRFYVGSPPAFSQFTGISENHYRRDVEIRVSGSGLGVITGVGIADVDGNIVDQTTSLISDQGNLPLGITVTVPLSEFAIAGSAFSSSTLDSVISGSRRMKITTPFGSVISDNNASGAFTVSASPEIHNSATLAFAGGGFDAPSSTYDLSNGNLLINGSNLRGINKIEFMDHNGTDLNQTYISAVDLNPAAPPTGVTFNLTGTQITVTSQYITDNNSTWTDSTSSQNRLIRITSVAGQSEMTPLIKTTP